MRALIKTLSIGVAVAANFASTGFSALLDEDPVDLKVDIVVEFTSTRYDGQVNMWFQPASGPWDTWVETGGVGTHESAQHEVEMKLGMVHEFRIDRWHVSSGTFTVENPPGYTLYIAEHNTEDLVPRNQLTDTAGTIHEVRKYKVMLVKDSADASGLGFGEADSLTQEGTLRMGLGPMLNGYSAGDIRLSNYDIFASTIDTSSLVYASRGTEVEPIYVSNKLRQVNAPHGLADIVTLSSTSFEVRFYSWQDVGAKSGGLYTLVGSPTPISTYKVTKTSLNVTMRKTVGSTYWESKITLSLSWPYPRLVYDWAKNSSAGSGSGQSLSYKYLWTIASGSGNLETKEGYYGRPDASSSFTESYNRYRKYTDYAWGRELVNVKEGYTNSSTYLTNTSYEYYTSTSDGNGHYRQLKKVTRNDGGYTRYTYYDDLDKLGQVKKEYSPFQDTQEGLVKEYTYGSDGSGENYNATQVLTKANGELVGKVTTTYGSETRYGEPVMSVTTRNYSDASNYVETVVKTFRKNASETFLRLRPHSIKRSDGTRTSYHYYDAGGSWQVIATHGTDDAMGESSTLITNYGGSDFEDLRVVVNKSTRDLDVYDLAARMFDSYTLICNSGASFDWVEKKDYTFDPSSRVTKIERSPYATSGIQSASTIFEASYSSTDGMLAWTEDEAGQRTEYSYDKQGRLEREEKNGVGSGDGYNATDTVVTESTYDGSSRLVKREVSDLGMTETVVSTWAYDKAGRLTSKSLDCCNTVTYSYPTTNQVKQLNGDGGDIYTQRYKDGTLNKRWGTATTPLWVKAFAKSADYIEEWSASQDFTEGSPYKDNWRMKRLDWLGRPIHERSPTEDGGSLKVSYTYNSKGQLTEWKTQAGTESGGSLVDRMKPYLYTYDSHANVLLEGLDVGGGGLSSASSVDRLTKTVRDFYEDGSGYWWAQVRTYAYPNANDETRVSTSRSRIAPSSGEVSRSYSLDSQNNSVTSWGTVNKTYDRVIVTNDYYPRPTGNATQVYKSGLLVRETSTAGDITNYDYDKLRRPSEIDGRDSVIFRKQYVANSFRVSKDIEVAPGNVEVTVREYVYGAVNRLTRLRRKNVGVNEDTDYTYNKRGQVTSVTGNGTYPIDYDYDSYGRRIEQIQDRGGSNESKVTWVYDDVENTGLMVQKRHYKTSTSYDDTDFEYSDLGQVSKRTWDRGVYTTYGYSTSTGELLTENHSDTTPDVTYTYDKMSRVKTVADAAGTRTFYYTENDDLALYREDLPNGWYGSSKDLYYAYFSNATTTDTRGGLQRVAYGANSTGSASLSYYYDDASGRIDEFTGYWGGYKNFDVHYDTDSDHVEAIVSGSYEVERTWETWRENRATATTYWGSAKRTDFNWPNWDLQGQYYDYTLLNYDNKSLAAQYSVGLGVNIKYEFDYDDRHQLTSWDTTGYTFPGTPGTTTYTYDSAGNRTADNDINGSDTYTVNGLNQLAQSSNILYDVDGNLTKHYDWSYEYDANNRVIEMESSSQRLEFTYDYMGRRIEKKVWDTTGTETLITHLRFAYNGMELFAELTSTGGIRKTFYWGLDKSDTLGGAGGAEGLLMIRDWDDSKTYLPSYDLSGNLVGLLNESGEWEAWYAYDSFGNVLDEGGDYAADNVIGFSTQYTDRETELVYYGLRYYHPEMGRFVNRDPIGEAGGANLYRFVGNAPVTDVDLWGLLLPPFEVLYDIVAGYLDGIDRIYDIGEFRETKPHPLDVYLWGMHADELLDTAKNTGTSVGSSGSGTSGGPDGSSGGGNGDASDGSDSTHVGNLCDRAQPSPQPGKESAKWYDRVNAARARYAPRRERATWVDRINEARAKYGGTSWDDFPSTRTTITHIGIGGGIGAKHEKKIGGQTVFSLGASAGIERNFSVDNYWDTTWETDASISAKGVFRNLELTVFDAGFNVVEPMNGPEVRDVVWPPEIMQSQPSVSSLGGVDIREDKFSIGVLLRLSVTTKSETVPAKNSEACP